MAEIKKPIEYSPSWTFFEGKWHDGNVPIMTNEEFTAREFVYRKRGVGLRRKGLGKPLSEEFVPQPWDWFAH